MHVQGWGMLNRESGKKSFGDDLLDYEKISWREYGEWRRFEEKKNILKESSWQWKRVLDVCIIGTGKSFRRWKEEMMCFGKEDNSYDVEEPSRLENWKREKGENYIIVVLIFKVS